MKQLDKNNSVFRDAEFIWIRGMEDMVNAYVDFHETIEKKQDAEYFLYITADSDYALYINGVFCDGGQYADYPDTYKVYDALNITDFLRNGVNEITVTGYCQKEDSSTYRRGASGVMYAFTENGQVIITSGLHTKANRNPNYISGPVSRVSGQLSFSFEYSFISQPAAPGEAVVTRTFETLHERPIRKLTIKDRCKTTPVVYGSFRDGVSEGNPGYRMQKAYLGFSARLREGECAANGGVLLKKEENSDGIYVIYDMGREESGLVTLDLSLPCDAEFLLGWGEHLDDLRIRTEIGSRCFAARFDGKAGRSSFIHPFKRSGCRYLALQIYAPEAEIYYAGITPTDYPTTADVQFRCADQLHNTIYETCKRTLLMCMHEHYEDCPWREQALYTMDSRNQMLCGYYAFREFGFAKSAIRLMALSIRDDNMLELCSPARVSITIPSFSAMFAVQLWEYLLYSGDREFAAEMVPTAERICREFMHRTRENGLLQRLKESQYWNFYEWQDDLEGTIGKEDADNELTYDLPLCAFVSMAYQSVSKIHAVLGNEAKAEEFRIASEKLSKAAHETFYAGEEMGYYFTYMLDTPEKKRERFHLCQLANALAVCSGICPDECIDGVLYNLAYNPGLLRATLSFSIFLYDALMKKPEKYARFVFEDAAKDYGYMLRHGATTFWETIRGGDDFGYAGSMCHGWSAVPIYLYFRYAAGIVPTEPGVMTENPMDEKLTGIYELNIE